MFNYIENVKTRISDQSILSLNVNTTNQNPYRALNVV
jgi:hypothetical protein